MSDTNKNGIQPKWVCEKMLEQFKQSEKKTLEERYGSMAQPDKNKCLCCKKLLLSEKELNDWMCAKCEHETNEVAESITNQDKIIKMLRDFESLDIDGKSYIHEKHYRVLAYKIEKALAKK